MKFKQSLVLLLLAGGFLLSFNACKTSDDDGEQHHDDSEVNFIFNYTVDGQALDLDAVQDINGTAVKFETVNFYVGGINFMPEGGGDPVSMGDTHLLIKPGGDHNEVGELEGGHYHMVQFFVGVAEEFNNQSTDDFTKREADDPLAEQMPSMHWSWNSGYKFVRIDGQVDTDGDGTPETALVFHLGNDERRTDWMSTLHHDIEGDHADVTFEFDLAKLFANIDLSTNYNFHTTADEAGTADIFTSNLASAITVQP